MIDARVAAVPAESARDHALRLLEFPHALELVAVRATSTLGGERVRSLRPLADRPAAEEALAATDDMVGFRLRTTDWTPPPIPDVRAALRRLAVDGSVLDEPALLGMSILLSSSRRARREIRRRSEDFRRVGELAEALLDAREERERLERSIEPGGEIADGASPTLGRLRREMRSERSSLVEKLERFASRLPSRFQVPDGSVTVRNGRYCIPVRREGRSRVGGIVHDESASSQTLFVEPPLAIEPMNRIRELELAESREVQRVLAELTGMLRPMADDLRRSLDALTDLDVLFALADYALEHGGSQPRLGTDGGRGPYRVRAAFHPILRACDERAVPFDLDLEPEETVLLVSGPNAGGKTVLLKSIGLLSALAQSGIVPPVGEGTRLPVFGSFYAVMGDEQSIEASLSTFSAQIGYLREILETSDGRSLVLIDEIGSHTDPDEGAALAAAALLRLAGQAALTAVSTHLGDLKTLAGEDPRIVNASLQFDPDSLRPTYRLVRDRPGRSYALEISQRLGMPEAVLEAARRRLSRESTALEAVLSDLEEREEEVERLRTALAGEQGELAGERARLAEQQKDADRRHAELEGLERESEREARRRAERYLLEARQDVERAISRLGEQVSDLVAESTAAPVDRETVLDRFREVSTEARRSVEGSIEELRGGAPEAPAAGPAPALRVGDAVSVATIGGTGRLLELQDDRAIVELGGVRITVAPQVLRGPIEPRERPIRGGEMRAPVLEARSEVDLRGLRPEEVEVSLIPVLDAAIQADLPSVRVIHGKGTGALRRRVEELLAADSRVGAFRLGAPAEGGSGVTIVQFSESG